MCHFFLRVAIEQLVEITGETTSERVGNTKCHKTCEMDHHMQRFCVIMYPVNGQHSINFKTYQLPSSNLKYYPRGRLFPCYLIIIVTTE